MNSPLVYLTTVLAVGVASQWLSWRLRFPAIIVLLLTGFLLGRFVNPDEIIPVELLNPCVSLAVAVILFEGGLSLKFREIQKTRRAVWRLCSLGVLLTWIPTTFAARLIFDSWEISALVGALFVVTGPTVIIPLLRHIRPHSRIGSIVKWEGIVNDPIGAILAVLVFETTIVHAEGTIAEGMMLGILRTLLIAIVIGGVTAWLLIQLLKRHLIPDYLENPVFLGCIVLTFTGSNLLQAEAGLATVTLLGILMANQKTVQIHHILAFKENLVVLLISVLFIVLSSRLSPSDLTDLGWGAAIFLAILIIAIRPFSIIVSTIGTSMIWPDRLFLAGLAPRGIVAAAVASVFALEISKFNDNISAVDPLIMADVQKLVPVTFLVIFGTVTIYGLAATPLAKLLGIADPNPQGILFAGAQPFVRDLAKMIQDEGFAVMLVDTNFAHMSSARMQGLPTQTASVLSDFVSNEIDLSGVGRLFAMTPNDEVNALAVGQFADRFGRANLFQLTPRKEGAEKPREGVSGKLTGRMLFDKSLTFPVLTERYDAGARLKKTPLTDEFEYEDFREYYGEQAVVLLIIDENRKLKVCTPEDETTPKTGQTLISLIDPPPEEETIEKRTETEQD